MLVGRLTLIPAVRCARPATSGTEGQARASTGASDQTVRGTLGRVGLGCVGLCLTLRHCPLSTWPCSCLEPPPGHSPDSLLTHPTTNPIHFSSTHAHCLLVPNLRASTNELASDCALQVPWLRGRHLGGNVISSLRKAFSTALSP